MSLCNYTVENGAPPQDCLALRQYMSVLAEVLHAVNPVRCGSGSSDPSTSALNALWSPCDVPPGATVHWYNTTSTNGSQWYCKEGSVIGCTWFELETSV